MQELVPFCATLSSFSDDIAATLVESGMKCPVADSTRGLSQGTLEGSGLNEKVFSGRVAEAASAMMPQLLQEFSRSMFLIVEQEAAREASQRIDLVGTGLSDVAVEQEDEWDRTGKQLADAE
jgi:hypothetical protein